MIYCNSKQNGVYVIHCSKNDFTYFGSAAGKGGFQLRARQHISALRNNKHHSRILQNHFNKYGEDVFTFNIVEICKPENCVRFEQTWIDLRGIGDRNKSYNINPTANSFLGFKHTEEFKLNLSLRQTGKKRGPRSEEVKARLRAKNLGHPVSEETRAKISAINKGRKQSPETVRRRMATMKLKPPMTQELKEKKRKIAIEVHAKEFVATDPTGKEYLFKNLAEFCRTHKLDHASMVDIATGKRISHKGGWTCRYDHETKEDQEAKIAAILAKHPRRKKYFVIDPDGNTYETINLAKFCRERNLCNSSMRDVLYGIQVSYKKWRVRYADAPPPQPAPQPPSVAPTSATDSLAPTPPAAPTYQQLSLFDAFSPHG